MHREISLDNLPALCRGISFLGSGGGGDLQLLLSIVEDKLTRCGPVPLITLSHLGRSSHIAAIELVGAPIPKDQRYEVDYHFHSALECAQKDLGYPIDALMAVEIGGGNGLSPLCIAGDAGLPLLDGDLLGRAFPKIQMISTNLFGIMPSRAYIADPESGEAHVLVCASYEELEKKARTQAMQYKTTAAVLIPIILKGEDAQKAVIPNTFSHALSIGAQVTLDALCQYVGGTVHGVGIVKEWDYKIKEGFLVGKVLIEKKTGGVFAVGVKNEYLSLASEGKILVRAPDIISLLRPDSLTPLLSDQIAIGDTVACVSCRGPEIWYSETGLALTNLFCFSS